MSYFVKELTKERVVLVNENGRQVNSIRYWLQCLHAGRIIMQAQQVSKGIFTALITPQIHQNYWLKPDIPQVKFLTPCAVSVLGILASANLRPILFNNTRQQQICPARPQATPRCSYNEGLRELIACNNMARRFPKRAFKYVWRLANQQRTKILL